MIRAIYFGITEIDGDTFITVSLKADSIDIDFNNEELSLLEDLEDYEIYMSTEGTYQAPPGEYDYDEIIKLLERDLIHSTELDNRLLED